MVTQNRATRSTCRTTRPCTFKDVLARVPGVGDVQLQGGRDYVMRIWLDPDKVATRDLSANEVLSALRAQNRQVSAGILNQPPSRSDEAYQINVEALGRLSAPSSSPTSSSSPTAADA
jgi:multidrug efflux pump subunit AcrB